MADQLQLRGGNTSQSNSFTGVTREVTVDTDKDTLVVHDGVTPGGFPLATEISITNSTIYFDDDTGGGSAADAYLLTPKPNTRTPTQYEDGIELGFVTINTNTGASTVDFAGIGVKNIKLADGSDPAAGDIDGRTDLVFDAVNDWFELVSVDTSPVPVFMESYESTEQFITNGGALVLAHGLSSTPTLIQCHLVCKTAEQGYSIGDELIAPMIKQATAGTDNHGLSVSPDSTNINLRYGSSAAFLILNKSTGVSVTLTNANWRLVVRAWS